MNFPEQQIYLQHTKSGVRCFESFVESLVKHDDVVSDAELIITMKRISKKLQTVINKWDSKLPNLTPIEPFAHHRSNTSLSKVPPIEDYRSLDEVVRYKKNSRSSTTSSTEIDPKPGCSHHFSATNYDEEKSIMMVFKDINEKLLLGATGFYVEEVTTGFWRCNACDVKNLPMRNLVTHVNGKAHKKKINFKGA